MQMKMVYEVMMMLENLTDEQFKVFFVLVFVFFPMIVSAAVYWISEKIELKKTRKGVEKNDVTRKNDSVQS